MFCKLRPSVQPLPWRSAGAQNQKTMKNKRFKIILGLTLLPFFAFIYFLDRAILVFLPWIEQKTVKKWFDDSMLMTLSVIRVSVTSFIWLIYSLIFN